MFAAHKGDVGLRPDLCTSTRFSIANVVYSTKWVPMGTRNVTSKKVFAMIPLSAQPMSKEQQALLSVGAHFHGQKT